MSSSHWVTDGYSTFGTLNAVGLSTFDLTIPAGATLKRFLVKNTSLLGIQTGVGYKAAPPAMFGYTITMRRVATPDKVIFSTSRRITSDVVGFKDDLSGLGERIYTRYHNAGDLELGCNQQCSYGRASDTDDWFLRCESGIGYNVDGATIAIQGGINFHLYALYVTNP